ncbi:MAG: mechanosensitive ion channel, partial [Anaerolineales bacterium]|nr:mechanosensitive ion channel [Anaerolineales bacterium]
MSDMIQLVQQLAVTYGVRLLGSIAIFIIGRWAARFIMAHLKRIMASSKVDATLVSFVGNILYYLLFALVIIAALGNLGIPMTSVVALLGGITLAVGFALQDSLSNLAAGVMIILLRPYRLGDIIEVNGEVGEATDIKIFHTQLTTLTNKVIFIPDNEVIAGNIVNYTEKDVYRLDMVFGIGYDDDLLKAKNILMQILKADERVKTTPAPSVIVGELGDNS